MRQQVPLCQPCVVREKAEADTRARIKADLKAKKKHKKRVKGTARADESWGGDSTDDDDEGPERVRPVIKVSPRNTNRWTGEKISGCN